MCWKKGTGKKNRSKPRKKDQRVGELSLGETGESRKKKARSTLSSLV